MFRIGLALALLASLAPSPGVDSSKSPYRIQEGFPTNEISRLQHRNDNFRKGFQGFNSEGVQSVILKSRVWNPKDQPLTVAFLGGSAELRGKIVSMISAWSAAANIRFDFGSQRAYREWTRADRSYAADIRIAFDEQGYWSFVGSDSIDPNVSKANQASMNFQGFPDGLPADWQGVVLHEFGHAVGFEHEHQSPAANCNAEFRFDDDPGYIATKDIYGSFIQDSQGRRPGIYTVLGGSPNNWDRQQVDFNLKQLPNTTDLRFSAFDLHSIMMYSFQSWMFVSGDQSSCYTPENQTLSIQDQRAALETYPLTVDAAVSTTIQNLRALQMITKQPHLSQDIKVQANARLQKLQ
jgi:hypothetical protein